MKFYHSTVTSNARQLIRIKKSSKLKIPEFNYLSYLKQLSHQINDLSKDTDKENLFFFREYCSEEGFTYAVWLGSGLYCFSEENKEESILFARKRDYDCILDINCIEDYTEFNMAREKQALIDFLLKEVKSGFMEKYNVEEMKLLIQAFDLLIEYLVLEIEDEYYQNPQLSGVIIELFLDIKSVNYDIISNKFLKDIKSNQYDNYTCIRNKEIITGFEYNYDLSRKIKSES